MVNKHTGELAADSLRHKRCSDRGIYAAGQRQQRAARTDLFPNKADRGLPVVCHRPIAGRAADGIEEPAEHFAALYGVLHFRVELHAIELFLPGQAIAAVGQTAVFAVTAKPSGTWEI